MQPLTHTLSNCSDHMYPHTDLPEAGAATQKQPSVVKRARDANCIEPMSDPLPKQMRPDPSDDGDKSDRDFALRRRDQSMLVPDHVAEDNPYFYVPSQGQRSAEDGRPHQLVEATAACQGLTHNCNDQANHCHTNFTPSKVCGNCEKSAAYQP